MNTDTSTENHRSLNKPAGGAAVILLFLCVIGIALAGYSLYTHVLTSHGWLTAPSACNINAQFNCDAVNASPYSELFGIPIASYGLAFYGLGVVAAITYLSLASTGFIFWQCLFVVGLLSLLASLGLFLISTFYIGTWCIVCIALYAVNALICFLGWKTAPKAPISAHLSTAITAGCALPHFIFGLGRFQHSPQKFTALMSGVIGTLIVGGTIFGANSFMVDVARPQRSLPPLPIQAKVPDAQAQQDYFKSWQAATPEPRLGLDRIDANLPNTKGMRDAPIRMVEFFDYECPACRRFHGDVEKILSQFGDKIYFVQFDFPLDQQCNKLIQRRMHPDSCFATELAHCAGEQGAFWKASEFLITTPLLESPPATTPVRPELERGLEAIGLDIQGIRDCVAQARYQRRIQASISLAADVGLEGTPSVWINERPVPNPSAENISAIISGILKK